MTFWVAGAVVTSSYLGSRASGQAANAQADAAAQSDATQRYMYDQTRKDNEPFRQTGLDANNRLAYLMGLSKYPYGATQVSSAGAATPASNSGRYSIVNDLAASMLNTPNQSAAANAANVSTPQVDADYGRLTRSFSAQDLANDPVYQNGLKFGLDTGVQGINRQAAAGGSFLSGATLKALAKYGNDYGSTKANESYNRFNTDQTNLYNRYAGLSGAGQQATNQVSAAGQNMANQVSASQQGAGNARASGYMGQANAIANGVGQYLNYNQNQNMMNAWTNMRNAPGSSFQPTMDWINNNGGGF